MLDCLSHHNCDSNVSACLLHRNRHNSPSVGTQHFAVSTLPYYGILWAPALPYDTEGYNWRYYTTKGSAALASITPDQGKPRPEFSKHWLESYKKRHQVRL